MILEMLFGAAILDDFAKAIEEDMQARQEETQAEIDALREEIYFLKNRRYN